MGIFSLGLVVSAFFVLIQAAIKDSHDAKIAERDDSVSQRLVKKYYDELRNAAL